MKLDLQFKLDQQQQQQWDRFWSQSRHTHPNNHLLFAEIERAKGMTPVYASGKVDDRIVCAGIFSMRPLLSGRYSLEAICQRGPIFDDVDYAREFLLKIIDRFKSMRIGSLRISPYWIHPEAYAVETMLDKLGFQAYDHNGSKQSHTGLVDLQPKEEEIFASLKSKTRQEIRRCEKLGVKIGPALNIEDAKPFYRCLRELHRKRSLYAIGYREFEATFEHVLKDCEFGILLNATYESTFLGGLWVIRDPNFSYYSRFVVEREALRKLSNLTIGPALWWEAIKWARDKGCESLNVEGYRSDTERSDRRYFLYKLKSKFNPRPVQIIAEHILVCDPLVFSVYKQYRFCRRAFNFIKGLPYQMRTRWNSYVIKRDAQRKKLLDSAKVSA